MAAELPDALPPLREVIARHGLAARKSLGQNFLLDLNLTARIARAAGDLSGHDVLEIGPGPGGLTRALLAEGARHVWALEHDARCLPALDEVAAAFPGRLTVIAGDALKEDPLPRLTAPVRIVANLPYNIGTELLLRWLTPESWPPRWLSLTLLFQKEVAERITARPGTPAWGRLGLLAQWRCESRIRFEIPPRAFTPAPKVTSALVHLTALPAPRAEADLRFLEAVSRAGFGQRRKMLRRALKAVHPEPESWLRAAGIDPEARAETLDVAAFCSLARLLKAQSET